MNQSKPCKRRFPAVEIARYPVLLLTHVLVLPALRIVDPAGGRPRMLRRAAARVHIRMASEAFGSYQAGESDVLVCAYFRSGTNWLLQIAHQVATKGRGEYVHIHDVIPWPDAPHARYAVRLDDDAVRRASPTGTRVIKTHLEWKHIPHSAEARYLYVFRDPKDVFVSSYHFMRDTVFGPLMPSVQGWLNFFLSDDFFFGSWAEHIDGFWKERNRDNLLAIAFEELRRDLRSQIRRIADFSGVALTPAELDEVHRKCSFDTMKTMNRQFYPGRLTPWASSNGSMIRRGESGTSSELLSPNEQERIDSTMKDALRRLESDFPYDDYFGRVE